MILKNKILKLPTLETLDYFFVFDLYPTSLTGTAR